MGRPFSVRQMRAYSTVEVFIMVWKAGLDQNQKVAGWMDGWMGRKQRGKESKAECGGIFVRCVKV